MKRAAIALAVVVLWPQSVWCGTRFEAVAMFAEERVAGARICFSRALQRQRRTVLERLLSGPETRCVTADKILHLPAGIWHFYIVSDEPYVISAHPIELVHPTASSDAEPVGRYTADLHPAATVRVEPVAKTVDPSTMLALYVTHRGSDISAPALIPVPGSENTMPVPARTPVIPIVLRDTLIVAVADEVKLEPGESADVTFPLRKAPTLVVPFRLPELRAATQSPTIRVFHLDTSRLIAEYVPRKAEWRGLLFFQNLPWGSVTVSVDGDGFDASPVSVEIPQHQGNCVITAADLIITRTDREPPADAKAKSSPLPATSPAPSAPSPAARAAGPGQRLPETPLPPRG